MADIADGFTIHRQRGGTFRYHPFLRFVVSKDGNRISERSIETKLTQMTDVIVRRRNDAETLDNRPICRLIKALVTPHQQIAVDGEGRVGGRALNAVHGTLLKQLSGYAAGVDRCRATSSVFSYINNGLVHTSHT